MQRRALLSLHEKLESLAPNARGLYFASATLHAPDLAEALAAFRVVDLDGLAAYCDSLAARNNDAVFAELRPNDPFVRQLRRALAETIKGRALYQSAYAAGAPPEA